MPSIVFNAKLTQSDPQLHPVLIIGQIKHLSQIAFSNISIKLGNRVTEETYKNAVSCLNPSPTDKTSLYLDLATVAALPLKCSRHNTESQAHAVSKIVKSCLAGDVDQSVVIVCEREHVFASGCAVARALPLFTRKTKLNPDNFTLNVEFVLVGAKTDPLTSSDIDCLFNVTTGIRLAARIVDTPCSEMNVSHFVDEVEKIAQELGSVKTTVIRGEELKTRGFGGIYGVGKAANCPPALAVLSHTPKGAKETICWVGKGIVFDTGGLSIKGKTAMPTMKLDCGGAAALLGAFYAAVKAGFTENLHAVFCLAENSVGPDSTRPDDIHTMYSGCTVEINNTDAEGRLVLSDGVVYADKDLKAQIILDMATLTGAQGVATGKYHGAVLTNSDEWEQKAVAAGRLSGDLLSPVPYCPELHFSEYASKVADMKNSVKDRNNALVSCAGLFIGANLGFDYAGVWIHVDMAYPAFIDERGTGYGVALLCTLFGNYTKCNLLKSLAPQVKAVEPPTKKARH